MVATAGDVDDQAVLASVVTSCVLCELVAVAVNWRVCPAPTNKLDDDTAIDHCTTGGGVTAVGVPFKRFTRPLVLAIFLLLFSCLIKATV